MFLFWRCPQYQKPTKKPGPKKQETKKQRQRNETKLRDRVDSGINKENLAKSLRIGFSVFAFLCVALAWATPYWVAIGRSWFTYNIPCLGLLMNCYFVSSGSNNAMKWECFSVYTPTKTGGNDRLRQNMSPGSIVITQLLYTVCLICVGTATVMTIKYYCRRGEEENRLTWFKKIGHYMAAAGITGAIAVLVFFFSRGDSDLGWSYVFAVIGVVLCFVSAALFLKSVYFP